MHNVVETEHEKVIIESIFSMAKNMAGRPLRSIEREAVLLLINSYLMEEVSNEELPVFLADILCRSGRDADGR